MERGWPAKQAARSGGEAELASGHAVSEPLANSASPPDPPLRGAAFHRFGTPHPRRSLRWSLFFSV